jgi:AraC-like DNA-binding protein
VVITALRDAHDESMAPAVRRLRQDFPRSPVIAYAPNHEHCATDILAVAQAGVNGLLLKGFEDSGFALLAALEAAEDHSIAQRASKELSPLLTPSTRPILEYCLSHARENVSVERMADALGVHRKTLVVRLGQEGLPSPRELLHWSRLLLAAHALEDAGRSLEQIALALDFPSAASLRNMMRRYTGWPIAELRAPGGFERVLAAMRQALSTRGAHSSNEAATV